MSLTPSQQKALDAFNADAEAVHQSEAEGEESREQLEQLKAKVEASNAATMRAYGKALKSAQAFMGMMGGQQQEAPEAEAEAPPQQRAQRR